MMMMVLMMVVVVLLMMMVVVLMTMGGRIHYISALFPTRGRFRCYGRGC